MKLRRSSAILLVSVALLLGIVLFWVKFRDSPSTNVIPSTGGAPLRLAVLNTPHFLQTDPRWAKEQIGGSGETLSRVGCTICCVAMVLNSYGVSLTPHELNEALKQADGYTPSGLLKWDSVSRLTGGRVLPSYIGAPDLEKIDSALKNGHPVIAKVMLRNLVQHWVLIVGKEGTEYLVRDPLNPQITKLSAVGTNLYAIRILKPA